MHVMIWDCIRYVLHSGRIIFINCISSTLSVHNPIRCILIASTDEYALSGSIQYRFCTVNGKQLVMRMIWSVLYSEPYQS